jgi:hypothetical protein
MVRFDGLRNTGGGSGDNDDEMLRRDRLDERTADAVLAGRGGQVEGDEVADLATFVTAVRSEATMVPARPNAMLAEVLAHGISADKGELPVTAASNVHGPATQVSGPPKRRIRTVLELMIAKLAALGLAAKAGAAVAAVAATTAGAGAAGVLPDTLQGSFDNAVRGVEESEDRVPDTDKLDVSDTEVDTEDVGVDGADIAEDASDPDDPGVDGREVADDASDGASTEGLQRAEDGRDNAPDLPAQAEDGRDNAPDLPAQAEDGRDNAPELPEEGESRAESGALNAEQSTEARDENADVEQPAQPDQGDRTTGSGTVETAPPADTPPVETPADGEQPDESQAGQDARP